jgi:hypothetical protein
MWNAGKKQVLLDGAEVLRRLENLLAELHNWLPREHSAGTNARLHSSVNEHTSKIGRAILSGAALFVLGSQAKPAPSPSSDFLLSAWRSSVEGLRRSLHSYPLKGEHKVQANLKLFPTSNTSRTGPFEVFRKGDKVRYEFHLPSYYEKGVVGIGVAAFDGALWRTYQKTTGVESGNVYNDPLKEDTMLPTQRVAGVENVWHVEPTDALEDPIVHQGRPQLLNRLQSIGPSLKVEYPVVLDGQKCFLLKATNTTKQESETIPTKIYLQQVGTRVVPVRLELNLPQQANMRVVTTLDGYRKVGDSEYPGRLVATYYADVKGKSSLVGEEADSYTVDQVGDNIDDSHFQVEFPEGLDVYDQAHAKLVNTVNTTKRRSKWRDWPTYAVLAFVLVGVLLLLWRYKREK